MSRIFTNEDSRKFTDLLLYAADCIRFYERVSVQPCCNTCGLIKGCSYRPEWGDATRINCPLYEPQSATIANTEEKQDITGKGGRKLTSIKRNKAVTISANNGMFF